jgi:cell division initiation protein
VRISPLDIRKQAFKKTMRGVDAEEVRVFLELVASEYEKVLQENAMMAERIRHQEERLHEYRELEKSMRNSLVTADRIASEARESSDREATRVVQDAQLRAERILEDARDRLQGLIREIEMLKGKKEVYARRFWTLIEGQLGVLQEHMEDLGEVDSLRRKVMQLMAETRPNTDLRGGEPAPAERVAETPAPALRQPVAARGSSDPARTAPEPAPDWTPASSREASVGNPFDDGEEERAAKPASEPRGGLARGLSRILRGRQSGAPAEPPMNPPGQERGDGGSADGPDELFPIRERREGYFEVTAREGRGDASAEERAKTNGRS